MPVVEIETLREEVSEKYDLARRSITLLEKASSSEISNRIPNHEAEDMNFGDYKQYNFVVLFADMRNSSVRARELGPKKTFLTIHALMPTLIHIIEAFGGYVIDLPGDGVMALFKNNRQNLVWKNSDDEVKPEDLGFAAGITILEMIKEVVNPIIHEDEIPPIEFGVGLTSGSCVVTKVGTNNTYDTKAIGNCINEASKESNGFKEMKISPRVYNSFNSIWKDGLNNLNNGWFSYKET